MILLCGIPSEAPLALALAAAGEANVPHLVLNQRQVEDWALELDLSGEQLRGTLQGPGGKWDLSRFTGVYSRLAEPDSLPDLGDPPDIAKRARARALHQGLLAWLELAQCRVVNRLGPSASNMSKPYQAQRILEAGLAVPPTLISNDPDEVRRFASAHGKVVYKSTSSVRSVVRQLLPTSATTLNLVRHLPTQFQAQIPGVDVRVHVVGEAVHATEVRSTATDYRYAERDGRELQMTPYELPAEIADRCRQLSSVLRLPFCGIDLRRTPSGRWFCFEVNPSPAYSFFEQASGQPIARALVEYLSGTASSTGERSEGADGAGDRELG